MPWKSEQQRKWGHTKEGIKALGGKKNVEHWNKETPKNIPRVSPKKKGK